MLVSVIYQHESPTGIHFPPSSWIPIPIPCPSPRHPSGLSQSTGLSSLCHTKRFPLAVSFTYGSAYLSMLFCQLVPPSPFRTVSTSLFSVSVFPLLFCKEVHRTIFLDSMFLFSHWVKSDSLSLHGPQHARPLCPSPSPEDCPSSCPLHQWYHPAVSSSDVLFSFYPRSFPASGTFPMSHLFASNEQNTRASALALVLPMSIQRWFPLRLIGLICLMFKELSGVWRHQFCGVLPSLWSVLTVICDHGKTIALSMMDLCQKSNVSAFQHTV